MNHQTDLIKRLTTYLQEAIFCHSISEKSLYDDAVSRAEALAELLEDWYDYRYENAYSEDLKSLWDLTHDGY